MPRLALFEIAEATIRHPVAARCEGAGCALFIRAPLVMDNRFVEPLAVEAHAAPAFAFTRAARSAARAIGSGSGSTATDVEGGPTPTMTLRCGRLFVKTNGKSGVGP
jgi:hypothetical protein